MSFTLGGNYMSSANTLEKPRKKTGGFASRLLGKQLEERSKRTSFEFAKPVVSGTSSTSEEKKEDLVANK